MSDTVIVGILSFLGSLIAVFLTNRKASALIAYRLEQLENKVDKHNNLIERTYILEQRATVAEEKIKAADHRIEELERGKNG